MIILIDGYNVLKQVIHKDLVDEADRNLFIKQLSKYKKKKGHAITLVFDGSPYDWVTKECIDGIYVIYAGVGHIADDYIKRYIEEKSHLDILLVSSDREIITFAKKHDIEYIDSMDFYDILIKGLKKTINQKEIKQTKTIKTSQEKNEELDKVMEDASKYIEYKTEDFKNEHELGESKSETLSKKEKKRLKQLKKL